MRDLVLHSLSGLILDFAEDDFGGAEQAAIIQAWRDRGHKPEFMGEFICCLHKDHEVPWLYLRQRGGLVIAAHYPHSGLAGSHEIVHGVSDEHKRQVDYMQRAGESVGFQVKREVTLVTRVRSDAVIYGSQVQMGVEVQRSGLTARAAKARTTQARYAGVEPVWFSDSHSDPKWLGHVLGVRMNPEVAWDTLPGQRSVTVVSGVRVLVPSAARISATASAHSGATAATNGTPTMSLDPTRSSTILRSYSRLASWSRSCIERCQAGSRY